MRRRSLAFTVDLLGEATITEAEADASRDEYVRLMTGLSEAVNRWPANALIDADEQGTLPRVNVSVKLSTLYSQFDPIDPDGTRASSSTDCGRSSARPDSIGSFVNIDMEQYAFKDLTIHLFRTVLEEAEFRDWPDVGIALQAYLRETEADLRQLAEWAVRRGTPVWVRLVKGAYWDYETINALQQNWPVPVWRHKWETDANYESLTRFLLENSRWLRPALGSHNIRSLAHALALAEGSTCRRIPSRFRCSTAWRTRSRTSWSAWAGGCVSTRLMASSCRAWRTSSAGCWRTRRTSRSCEPVSRSTFPRSNCS